MNTLLQEKDRALATKRGELKKLFDDHRDPATGALNMTADQVKEVNDRNDELTRLGKEYDDLYKLHSIDVQNAEWLERQKEVDRKYGLPGAKPADDTKHDQQLRDKVEKSLGQLYVESKEYKAADRKRDIKEKTIELEDVDLKTLMQTSAGWLPETTRNRGVVLSAQRPLQLSDLLPTRQVTETAISYMEETTFTNNAAEVSQGSNYGEAALALTERSVNVRKIGVWLPITDEQLEDVVGIQGYLDNRLPFMVRQRLDGQILNGTGVAPQVLGVLSATNLQTQAKGADPVPDAIYKAMTKVRVTGRAIPGGVVMHPNDWQDIRLLRTADGIYIWGSPSDAGPERIWGQAIILADSITEGTAVVGDWAMFSELAYKRGLEVQVTNSHGEYFIAGKQAIRADVRAVICWYRGVAFCQITGI